ncbi:MAG TPA: AmmeMemoRadiSam system protein B, partial [Patescibacteria group bacterium]
MKKIIITALCLTTSAVIFILQLNKPTPTSLTIDQNFSTDFAYDNKQFLIGVAGGQLNTEKDLPSLDTLIIPHHLTASTLMAEGIYQLATKTNPKIIVVLSPNHADIGGCPVITSFKGWSTPFGVVSPDSRIIGQLLTSNLICTDDNNLGIEHGIATLLPFIKYYLPNARIVPLAFKRNISLEDLQKVSEKIYKISNLSVIASIDFSHGLPPSESKSKDEETLNLINEQDISRIANLSSQYLDSPPALITLMNINKLRNNKQVLITHADAASVSQKDNDNDTSYYVIGYYPQDSRKNWTLIATGDVMLGRSVNTQSVKKNDYTWAFKNIAHLLKSADITLINLESPLTEDCRPTDEGMTFCGKAENVQGLVYSGVDVANIANNHIYNQGLLGLDQTITVLNNNNVSPVGIGHISVKDIGGTQAAFIGFDTTTKQD